MLTVFCATAAAICTLAGGQVGPYVDNETPQRCQAVISLLASQSQPVFYGVGQGETGFHCKAGGIKLQEWYPYWNGVDQLGPPPADNGYILQWSFAWPGSPPPTVSQRNRLQSQAESHDPDFIVRY